MTSPTTQQKRSQEHLPQPLEDTLIRESSSRPQDRYKRMFDLVMLVAAHILLAPLFLALWTLVPLSIWLEDRGPALYTQRRVGRDGKVFRLFKFRSMTTDAESHSGPVWASERDPRITRVGRFIRATALDELPQVLNVWKGDMSLVGPRPERPELVDEFSRDLPQFLTRLQVQPGLTGLAQVFGSYSSSPRSKLRYDALYISKMSPWLDLKLLVLSVYVTLLGRWQRRDKGLPRQRHSISRPTGKTSSADRRSR